MEEQAIILVLEEENHRDKHEAPLLSSENKFIQRKKEAFKDNSIVVCERCGSFHRIRKDSEFYQSLIKGDDLPDAPAVIRESLPFWQCCQSCREEEASYYDVAILADHMIEYMVADKQWFFDEVHIEKRWVMTREEIEERAREMRKPLDYLC